MKNLFKTVLAAAVLSLPALAFAGPSDPMSDIGSDGGTFSDFSTGTGAFSDSFAFSLSGGSGYWTVTDILGSNFGVSGLTLSLTDNGSPVSGTTATTFVPVGPGVEDILYTDTFPTLTSGSYVLGVSGTFLSAGSGYGGVFKVIPAVPEPSTWLAMAVGLGLMAFSASRHRRPN